MNPHLFAEFTRRIAGEVIVPESPAYDQVRTVFNQEARPAVIVRGQSHEDIVTALRFAREGSTSGPSGKTQACFSMRNEKGRKHCQRYL
jgi:hypothetical protein